MINISHFRTQNLNHIGGMFYKCASLTSIDIGTFNFEKITSIERIFEGCSNLVEINMLVDDTPLLDKMNNAFMDCSKLETVYLPRKLENVKNVEKIFENCEKLEYINLSPFNTSSLQYINHMFYNCISLKSVEFPIINADSLLSTSNMFFGCTNLNRIDMRNFNTSYKLNNLEYMFCFCESLTYLDISQLKINRTSKLNGIFNGVISNITVKVSDDIDPALKKEIDKLNIKNIDIISDN